jgi:hypothetical protein
MFISNENINHSNSIKIIPANTEKSILILVLGRASDVFWGWEAEEGFKHLYAEVEAILPPGNDPSKQDLVLTVARLIWIRRELVPKPCRGASGDPDGIGGLDITDDPGNRLRVRNDQSRSPF